MVSNKRIPFCEGATAIRLEALDQARDILEVARGITMSAGITCPFLRWHHANSPFRQGFQPSRFGLKTPKTCAQFGSGSQSKLVPKQLVDK